MSQNMEQFRQQAIDLLMKEKEIWRGTPEEFLVFVKMMELAANPPSEAETSGDDDAAYEKRTASVDRLGGIFQNIYQVDFSPYHDFTDLRSRADVNKLMLDVCQKSIDHLEGEQAIENAINTGEITVSEETAEQWFCSDIQTEVFMKKLSQFVEFKPTNS